MVKDISATLAWFPNEKGNSWRVYFSDESLKPNLKYHKDFMYKVYNFEGVELNDRVRNSLYDYANHLNSEGVAPSKSLNLAILSEILSGDY